MFGVFPLTPAYGRDYASATSVAKAFREGKDFITTSGQYCSIRDFAGKDVPIRYSKLSKVVIISVPESKN